MNPEFKSFYPAKKDYDNLVKNLHDIKKMDINQRSKVCLEIYKYFELGIPYQDRGPALNYYYQLMPLTGRVEFSKEQEKLAGSQIMDAFNNIDLINYIRTIEPAELFDVCQIRGELYAYLLFESFENNFDELKKNWASVFEEAEEFMNNEPCIPIRFLEDYMHAMFLCNIEKQIARVYELSEQVLENSINLKYIEIAYLNVKDPEYLRAYKKKIMKSNDIEKLLLLENLEKEVEAEFGGSARYTKNIAGKAFNMITKEGRERRAAQKDYQQEWILRIMRTARSSEPYIKGYAEFLSYLVYRSTDDMKKGIKALEKAYEFGFDEYVVLHNLYHMHNELKHNQETIKYAQKCLDLIGYNNVDEIKDITFEYQYYLSIKKYGAEPLLADKIWKQIAEQNKAVKHKIIEELKPKVDIFREEDKKRRILKGMKIFDSILLPDLVEKGFQTVGGVNGVILQTPVEELLKNSLEEFDFFISTGADSLYKMYQGKIGLTEFLNYFEKLLEKNGINLFQELKKSAEEYPNFVGCIPLLKNNIDKFISLGKPAEAEFIIKHAVSIRTGIKASLLYRAVNPFVEFLKEPVQLIKKIEILELIRPFLYDSEYALATQELVSAYIGIINNEKSPVKKDKYLKETEKLELKDSRFDELRKEVDESLYKRKKLFQKIAITSGVAIILIVIILLVIK